MVIDSIRDLEITGGLLIYICHVSEYNIKCIHFNFTGGDVWKFENTTIIAHIKIHVYKALT